ncbi:MAG: signal peptidase I [Clostridia bacterium]|nr:signal peptidase I [Clostridia bacterium]
MKEETKARIKDIIEWIVCIIIALIIAIAFRFFVGTPTIVQQPSMVPTLQPNQRLWLNRWVRTTKKMPSRGDIITFEAPSQIDLTSAEIADSSIARYENEPTSIWNKFSYYVLEVNKTSYIKRVIGLPGDHVEIRNGKVYINSQELQENYLPSGIVTDNGHGNCTDIIVPDNCVFAMGDNRAQSSDCRRFGCIPLEKIESKVWIRIWPLNLFGKIDK